MKKQQYIKPQASVIIIQNNLLSLTSDGSKVTIPASADGGNGSDAASRVGGWDDDDY